MRRRLRPPRINRTASFARTETVHLKSRPDHPPLMPLRRNRRIPRKRAAGAVRSESPGNAKPRPGPIRRARQAAREAQAALRPGALQLQQRARRARPPLRPPDDRGGVASALQSGRRQARPPLRNGIAPIPNSAGDPSRRPAKRGADRPSRLRPPRIERRPRARRPRPVPCPS